MTRMIHYALFLIVLFTGTSNAMGEDIAYLAFTEGYWQVWSMSPDGSNKRQVTRSEYDKSHLSWYPDGTHLLVNGNQGELNKVVIETGNEQAIKVSISGTVDAVLSPDGKYIAFSLSVADSVDDNHIWLVNADGSNLRKLTNMKGLQHEPVWSSDGNWIYFLSGTGDQVHDIWRYSLRNKAKEQMTVGQLYNFDVALSPAGDLSFSSNRSGNYEIWMQKQGEKPERLTNHPAIDARPSWSPKGDAIVFESSRNGAMNIWCRKIDSDVLVQLTDHPVGARYPLWRHSQADAQ